MADKNDGYPIGTVVRLKSGGPKMTVSSDPAQRAATTSGPWEQTCQWFVDNMAQENNFPIASLKEVFETSHQSLDY
ncbi:DUF2158 domain-containing protein [bacterium]|nr:MAG: DUF2158 domain-containing protein [bacterium]